MFRNTLILLLLCCVPVVFSQTKGKPGIEFSSSTYDFGTVKEAAGKVTHEFVFSNTGTTPLVIQQVTASCGCTTPGWTKQPIAPGANGKITVTYNAAGRPGHFTKTITVVSNADNNPVQLIIHGMVIPRPLSQDQAFPVDFGAIRLKSSIIPVGNIAKGEIKHVFVPVVNSSDKPVTLALSALPRHITAVVQPAILAPGKEASLQITYNSTLVNDWAFRNDPVLLVVNGDKKASEQNKVTITGYIAENFALLTPAQRQAAPVGIIAEKEVKLGKIEAGKRITGSVVLKNTGKLPLLIRKAFSDCGCISFNLPKQGIPAGKSSTLSFTLQAGTHPGQIIENVNLMTNSPATPDLQFQIDATVTTPPHE